MRPLVLASTSPFRRGLLARLGLPFEVVEPGYREEPVADLGPADLALRHAEGKTRSAAATRRDRVVIGSDQVAAVGGELLGKPGTAANARRQLARMAGREVAFHTGLAVARGNVLETCVECYRVRLRPLDGEEIASYVEAERPLSCAGSFRIEGLGIALMAEMGGADYTTLVGLPLIALTRLLARVGVDVLRRRDEGPPGRGVHE